jgi:hypothetical protein
MVMQYWAMEPSHEVAVDPMHLADMAIVEGWARTAYPGDDKPAEVEAAVSRIHARSVWVYEEAGRRHAAALRAWRNPEQASRSIIQAANQGGDVDRLRQLYGGQWPPAPPKT